MAAGALGFGLVFGAGKRWLDGDPRTRLDSTFVAEVESESSVHDFISTKFRCERKLRVVVFSTDGEARLGLRFLQPEQELPRCVERFFAGETIVISDNFEPRVDRRPKEDLKELYWPNASAFPRKASW